MCLAMRSVVCCHQMYLLSVCISEITSRGGVILGSFTYRNIVILGLSCHFWAARTPLSLQHTDLCFNDCSSDPSPSSELVFIKIIQKNYSKWRRISKRISLFQKYFRTRRLLARFWSNLNAQCTIYSVKMCL